MHIAKKKKMKLQNVLILVLIAFILINIGIGQIIQRVRVGADTTTSAPFTMGLSVTTAETDGSTEYAQLNLEWKPKSGYTPPTGKLAVWVINIYNDDKHLCLNRNYTGCLAASNYPREEAYTVREQNFSSDAGIVWKSGTNSGNYKVTLDLRIDGKTVGSVTHTINTGTPKNNGTTIKTGDCPVDNLTWAPFTNTADNVVFKWTGLPTACQGKGYELTIWRPDTTTMVGYNIAIDKLSIQDGSAQSGTYNFVTVDNSKMVNGKNTIVGTRYIGVDLTNTNTPTAGDPTLTGGLTNSSTADDSVCTKMCTVNTGWNPATWLGGAMENALCKMQCIVISWMTSIIQNAIEKMMLPALGI